MNATEGRASNLLMDIAAKLAAAEAEIARLRARDMVPIRTPCEATAAIRDACETEQESFVVVVLNARQQILHTHKTAIGTVSQVECHPRDVFRIAVRMNAHAIIVGHNHPSGSPEPSSADIELTKRLVAAGRVLGIPVVDHIIVADKASVSLASRGFV